MNKSTQEVADIIRLFRCRLVEKHHPPPTSLYVLDALARCRSAELGGHVDVCNTCGHTHISYNSCRNRHCPKCQGLQRENWILQRKEEYLPVKYFHMVFTVPSVLNPLFLKYKKDLYSMLFKSAWQTILTFSKDSRYIGGRPAMTALLHTWGSNLEFHPHLHCLVPAGGVNGEKWIHAKGAKSSKPWLFPVKALSLVFRAKFFALLDKTGITISQCDRKKAFDKQWVVYCKHPLHGTEKVIEYIGRYSHRVAITNHRIIHVDSQKVTFRYKDYKDKGLQKEMTINGEEFLRRFILHILPKGFVRIRHFGFLSPSSRELLRTLQAYFQITICPKKRVKKDWKEMYEIRFGVKPGICPICKIGHLITVSTIKEGRAPPIYSISNQRLLVK